MILNSQKFPAVLGLLGLGIVGAFIFATTKSLEDIKNELFTTSGKLKALNQNLLFLGNKEGNFAAFPCPPSVPQTTAPSGYRVESQGFWVGADVAKLHVFDAPLAKAIISFLEAVQAESVCDLGCGMGLYSKAMKNAGYFVSCYDGNPQTQLLSNGTCATIDLSKPLNLTKHEWVLSLEVGEHIPAQFEDVFLSNLHNTNERGLIISWAIEGQGGTAHVNNHNNDYVIRKVKKLGYTRDAKTEAKLRTAATAPWFKNTLMVFRKKKISII